MTPPVLTSVLSFQRTNTATILVEQAGIEPAKPSACKTDALPTELLPRIIQNFLVEVMGIGPTAGWLRTILAPMACTPVLVSKEGIEPSRF